MIPKRKRKNIKNLKDKIKEIRKLPKKRGFIIHSKQRLSHSIPIFREREREERDDREKKERRDGNGVCFKETELIRKDLHQLTLPFGGDHG
jgi:hypothetical protein